MFADDSHANMIKTKSSASRWGENLWIGETEAGKPEGCTSWTSSNALLSPRRIGKEGCVYCSSHSKVKYLLPWTSASDCFQPGVPSVFSYSPSLVSPLGPWQFPYVVINKHLPVPKVSLIFRLFLPSSLDPLAASRFHPPPW